MKSQLFCAATLLVAAATLSACDSAPSSQPSSQASPRQVTVVGSGEVQGAPDTVTVAVGIESVAPDAATAMNQTNDRQRAVIEALTGQGIGVDDISTTAVTLAPQYGENAVITGYRAGNTIDVTIHQLDKAPRALATIVSTGGNAARINGVNFSIADDSKLIADARARAFEDAKSRANQYAELAGDTLGRIVSISEAPGGTPPRPVPMPRGAMASDVPLQPGQQSISFAVTAVWELN